MNWAALGAFLAQTFSDVILVAAGFHLAVMLILLVYLAFTDDVLPKE